MPVGVNRSLLVALVAVFGVVGVVGVPAAPVESEVTAERGAARIDSQECRVLGMINAYRRKNGARPLQLSRDLNEAADFHSRDMARHKPPALRRLGGALDTGLMA